MRMSGCVVVRVNGYTFYFYFHNPQSGNHSADTLGMLL